jgi:hypothetical protein
MPVAAHLVTVRNCISSTTALSRDFTNNPPATESYDYFVVFRRWPSVRKRSALSRMKPSASFWS